MFKASEIANFWPYQSLIQKPDAQVSYLAHDSRKLYHPSNTLFAAISGIKNDGHQYIKDALKLGVCNFIIEDKAYTETIKEADANYFLSPSAIEGLQLIASKRREKWQGTMIAITGSNGKTITKEWAYHLIENKTKVYRSPKSYNSQLGVALSIWTLPDHADFAIIEAGISKPGEMEKLEKIIQPDFGLITNIGSAHQENFESLEQKIDEKISLFKNCNRFVFPESDQFLSNYIKKLNPVNTTSIEKYSKEKLNLVFPEMEKAEIQNSRAAALLANLCNSTQSYINENLKSLPQISMRLEIKEGKNHSTLLCDYYNADFESLNVALAALKAQKNHPKKWIILSDIQDVGMQASERIRRLTEIIKQVDYDQLILISPVFNEFKSLLPGKTVVFDSVADFLNSNLAHVPSDTTILLK